MKLLVETVRALIGLAFGIFGFISIPIYGMPFSGCLESPWFGAEPGCSHWPEVLRGVLVVLPIAVIAPARWKLPIAATALLFILSFFGGFDGLQLGIRPKTAADLYHIFLGSWQNFVGGLSVTVVWLFLNRGNSSRPSSKILG